jgi:hypothetical protein
MLSDAGNLTGLFYVAAAALFIALLAWIAGKLHWRLVGRPKARRAQIVHYLRYSKSEVLHQFTEDDIGRLYPREEAERIIKEVKDHLLLEAQRAEKEEQARLHEQDSRRRALRSLIAGGSNSEQIRLSFSSETIRQMLPEEEAEWFLSSAKVLWSRERAVTYLRFMLARPEVYSRECILELYNPERIRQLLPAEEAGAFLDQ